MDFQKLVNLYEELEKVSSGNKLREILSKFYKEVPKEEVKIITYLTLGKFCSDYDNVILGLAEKSVLKAIAQTAGVSSKKIKEVIKKKGDAGSTAEELIKNKPRTLVPVGKLTVNELFITLHKIAQVSGAGSQEKKTNLIISLLQKTSGTAAKYLTRILLGTLRMGVGEMTVLDALAIAFTNEKANKESIEKAYNICPDVGLVAEIIAKNGLKGLDKIEVKVGRPIKMMLAQRIKDLSDLVKKMPGKVAVEGKYDGERVQIHKDKKGKISLFSRRLDNTSKQFPDLVGYLEKLKGEFIVEAEIVAIDESGKILPFQTLMQRRRKYDIEEYIKRIPVQAKFFDLLYLNDKSYLHEPYEKRFSRLSKLIKENKNLKLATRITTSDLSEINKFFKKILKEGDEGIMIKSLSGEYQAGTRGWNWIKWKKDYVQELIDTFDLVIVGAFHGRGRRSGGYGAFLCASYNEKEDQFETVCKIGTGLTDAVLEELPRKLEKFQTNKRPTRLKIKKEMYPDVWFEPSLVVEVLAAEITKSPSHTCAGGLALRFPRFVRYREKKAEQATTSEEISQIK